MKKFIFALMGLMGIVMFASCDKDSVYDESAVIKSKVPTTPKDTMPSNPEPKDTLIWDVPSKKSLEPVGDPSASSHKWAGTMVFYCGKDSLVKKADQTVEFSMTPATGFSSAKTTEPAKYTGVSSISLNSQNTTYGEYYTDAEGNKLRQVTLTAELKTSEFNKTLNISRREAWAQVNGREHAFLTHNMSAQFKSLDVVKTEEVERGDSVFEQKTYRLTFNCKFAVSAMNVRTYEVSATHVVESFIKVKEQKSEEMPSADLYVGKLIKATDIVAFPVWVSNDKIQSWSKGSLVEDEKVYHMWVDGRFVGSYEKSKLSGTNYNAVMLDGENYVPCLCKPDGKEGFYYGVEYADGSYKIQTVDERLAVSSGLKNFSKDNVASQTPYVKTTREQKSYSGKSWLKLTGYDVNGKPTISYTVAER